MDLNVSLKVTNARLLTSFVTKGRLVLDLLALFFLAALAYGLGLLMFKSKWQVDRVLIEVNEGTFESSDTSLTIEFSLKRTLLVEKLLI